MGATRLLATGVATLLVATSTPALLAQHWTKVPPPGIPLTRDGKPDLLAPTPRTPDGKPDLSGKWSSKDNTFARDLATGLKEEDVPFQPWAKALFDKRKDGSYSREDPDANCLPQGVPKIGALAYPWRLIQTPGSIVIIYKRSRCGGKSSWMAASWSQIPIRRGWDTRRRSGTATRSSSTLAGSTAGFGWISSAGPRPARCTPSSSSVAEISGTWTFT
jgi:hypothetical protein